MKALSLFICLSCVVAGVLQADPVIKFDDLPSTGLIMPPGYHGLNWSNIYYQDGVNYKYPSGYKAGVVSPNIVINGGDYLGTGVITAGLFDFISAYATGAWNDNLKLETQGYLKGTLIYD